MQIWTTQTYRRVYIIWITALTHYYTDSIISGLVKKGYAVANAADNAGLPYTGDENYLGSLISLKVEPNLPANEEINAAQVHNDVMDIINEIKAMCYSVVVSWVADSAWMGSNIYLSPKPAADPIPPTPPSSTNKNDLN